jgi:hypothetical protein
MGGQTMEIKIDVPDGKSGDWSVETFTVTKTDEQHGAMMACFSAHSRGRYVPAGKYKALKRNGHTIMSNTPDEIRDFRLFIGRATGNVLINGLGLGVVLKAVVDKPDVKHVTVIEISQDVINLIANSFSTNPKVEIICADALEYKPPKGTYYDAVWNDIWDDICTDNLKTMGTLHRKYGRRSNWIGSWGREICQYHQRRDRNSWY